MSLAEQLGVHGAIDVILQRFDRLPHRHVQENTVVVWVRPEVSGVACISLQAPDEAGSAVSERVDFLEPIHEAGHDRAVEWSFDTADVDLREMVLAHDVTPDLAGPGETKNLSRHSSAAARADCQAFVNKPRFASKSGTRTWGADASIVGQECPTHNSSVRS